jgi:hypothetical protein
MLNETLLRQLAADWHTGQWSELYAFASTGKVRNASSLENEIADAMRSAKGKNRAALAQFYATVSESVCIDSIYQGAELWHRSSLNSKGFPHRVKVTSVKTWKTRPGNFAAKAKFGLKTWLDIDQHDRSWVLAPR